MSELLLCISWPPFKVIYRKSSIKLPFSVILLQIVMVSPGTHHNYHKSLIMIVTLHVDWSDMVYSCTAQIIFSCMTSNFIWLSFSSLHSTSLWKIDTIIFAKIIWIIWVSVSTVSFTFHQTLEQQLPQGRYPQVSFVSCEYSRLSLTDTSTRWTPRWNRYLELVPAFLYSLNLTLNKVDIALRPTLSRRPKGIHLREGWLYCSLGWSYNRMVTFWNLVI